MIGLRPKPSARYLVRPRLLRQLPDEPGYAVWLQAPYGYGKSVLASQWADQLETEGWRVIWVALAGRKLSPVLARTLDLPPNAPWGVLTDALWSEPTLVVLEAARRWTPYCAPLRGSFCLQAARNSPTPNFPASKAQNGSSTYGRRTSRSR